MTHVLTLVASQGNPQVSDSHFREAAKILAHYNVEQDGKRLWLDKGKAGEISIYGGPQSALIAHLRDFFAKDKIDFFITAANNRQKKLLLADMDSTIASTETLDELADYAGIKDKIAAITAQAMEGKLDFKAALRERVGLLKDLPVKALKETLEKTTLNPGAESFAPTMKAQGATCVLVSGGFTFFTEAIAARSGFEVHHGNILEIDNEKLTGQVREPILDKFAKVDFLERHMQEKNLKPEDCLTIGDGANDVPMLKKAGLGIGYHPKKTVLEEVHNAIIYGDLTAALYAQGYSSKYFKTL
ncbi:MAG: phosphoserine phosphatase SerB [Rhodospirillales bacterium]|nr:phosphoserine phosphatase SerB [Alphaproteobacteria bacterium]MCB1840037.1 phosphoserine phosphatase SerB [Alphaproteobacteria bacterium]MCB9977065.1 phosphoserine phosphatase SerB [Rhodospirillales bacterium]